jgi:hypothetical protein
MKLAALVVSMVVAGACKNKDDGPSCAQVVDHMLDVLKQGLTGHGTIEVSDRQQRIQYCEQHQLSVDARRCLFAAKDLATFGDCYAKYAPKPDSPAPAPAPAPSPARPKP